VDDRRSSVRLGQAHFLLSLTWLVFNIRSRGALAFGVGIAASKKVTQDAPVLPIVLRLQKPARTLAFKPSHNGNV
jgi:hypothetical protein